MITTIFLIKLVLLFCAVVAFTIMSFHVRETARIEKRLGITLPKKFKKYSSVHLTYIGFVSLVFLALLFT